MPPPPPPPLPLPLPLLLLWSLLLLPSSLRLNMVTCSLPSLARWRVPPVVADALAWPTKAFFMAASRRCRFFSAASSSS